jgi:hypothetical protein
MDQGINNTFLLAGTFENSITITSTTLVSEGFDDGFVTRFDSEGNYDWAYQMGGTGSITVRGCASDPDGNYFLGGDFVEELKVGDETFYPVGAYDLFLSKLGEEGVGIPSTNGKTPLQLSISPNPASGYVNLSFSLVLDSEVRITIRDVRGIIKRRLTAQIYPSGKKTVTIDLEGLKSGMYYLTLEDGKNFFTEKIILSN